MCISTLSLYAYVPLSVCFNSHSQRASVSRSANWPSYKYRGGCSQIGKKGNRLQSDTKLPSVTVLSIRQQLKSGKWNKNKEKQNTQQGENSAVIVLWRLQLLCSTRVERDNGDHTRLSVNKNFGGGNMELKGMVCFYICVCVFLLLQKPHVF